MLIGGTGPAGTVIVAAGRLSAAVKNDNQRSGSAEILRNVEPRK
jgi:hypothetical protein